VDKYYWGYDRFSSTWQLFAADDPQAATPEASGYFAVSAPYDTRKEAEEDDPRSL
jgi:hypothetical protein